VRPTGEQTKPIFKPWWVKIMDEPFEHVALFFDIGDGIPRKELVHAVRLKDGRFRLLHSPGYVQGIAAGDVFRIMAEDGEFIVEERAGVICVQLHSQVDLGPEDELVAAINEIGGVLDGRVQRGLVFSVPLEAGFQAIENIMNAYLDANPYRGWQYGNIYLDEEGLLPLDWWQK
jgi:hypothetical protein